MKKILSVLLVMLITLTAFPVPAVLAAGDVTILFDFEGFADGTPTQDAASLDWMGYDDTWETPWVSSSFAGSDTWLEPAARTGSESGTAMRMVTKDGTTAYSAANRNVFMSRGRKLGVSETYPEAWFSFDWMVEDHNAEHSMRTYLQQSGASAIQRPVFIIGTDGALSTTAGATDVTISPGVWHTYEMCMSMTDGLLFYLDGQLLNRMSTDYTSQSSWLFMQVLNDNGSGQFKGTAMQFDNFEVLLCGSIKDKRLFGLKNDSFTEGADGSSVTFTATPFNVSETAKPYLMVLSVYDAEGRYVTYNTVSGVQEPSAEEAPVSVTVNEWGEGWSAKVHVLSSWTDRTPFVNKIYRLKPETPPTVFVYKNFDTATGGLNGISVQANVGASLVEAGTESYYALSNASEQYVSDVPFTNAGYELMFEVMVKQEEPGAELTFMNVDAGNSFDWFLSIGTGGAVTVGKTGVGSLVSGQWNHIAVATNFLTHKMSVWLNGTLVAQNIDRRLNGGIPVKIRLYRPASDTEAEILVDNLYVYSGNEMIEPDGAAFTAISILGNDYAAKKSLAGKQAVHAYSSQIAVDGVRKITQTPAFTENGVIYAAQDDLADMLDAAITVAADSHTVSVDSRLVTLTQAAVLKNGAVYLPVKELAEALSMTTLQSERGVLVFAEDSFTMDDATLKQVNDYMQYGRLTPAEVSALLSQKTSHPRTMVSPTQIDVIRNAYLNQDAKFMELYNYCANHLFYPNRVVYEDTASASIFWVAIAFASGWLASHDPALMQRVWECVEVFCNKPDWHYENDSLTRAHATITVAMAYDWFYDEWNEEQLALMEECIIEFGLKPVETVLKGSDPGLTNVFAMGNNINAICASAALVGAVAVWDKAPELASYIVAECMRGLERVQSNFFPGGAWNEGSDYAAYMMAFLPLGLSTIETALGHDYGFITAPGVKEHALFTMATLGNRGGNNYHDGSDWSAEQATDGVAIAWASHAYNSPEYYQMRKDYQALGGLSQYPQDILYYNPEWESSATQIENPLDTYFADSELFSMRSSYEKDGVYLSAHFGAESASHSHYDNGTFVLDMLGERWALDLGKDDYTLPGYFITGTRDNYYRVRPEGHNTFVINPDTSLGHSYYGFGIITRFESSAQGAIAVGDMTSVYTNSESAKRGFMLTDNRSSVIIRDEIRMEQPSDVYWFMHTAADIEIVDSTTAILTKNGKQVKLSFISGASGAVLSEMAAQPLPTSPNPEGQMTNEGVSKIAIYIPLAEAVDLTVRITPVGSAAADTAIPDVPLDEWTVPGN